MCVFCLLSCFNVHGKQLKSCLDGAVKLKWDNQKQHISFLFYHLSENTFLHFIGVIEK